MRTGRPKSFSISLNDRERDELGNLARSRSLPHALVRRAKIVLLADQGWSNTDIAEQLEIALERFARQKLEIGGEIPALTRERHRQALEQAVQALARIAADPRLPPEIVAEEIRIAQNAVGRIAGRVDVEDVLGEIFGRFCIGK